MPPSIVPQPGACRPRRACRCSTSATSTSPRRFPCRGGPLLRRGARPLSLHPKARQLYPGHAFVLGVAGLFALTGTAGRLSLRRSPGTSPARAEEATSPVRLHALAPEAAPVEVDEDERSERSEWVNVAQANALRAKLLRAWRRSLTKVIQAERARARFPFYVCANSVLGVSTLSDNSTAVGRSTTQ